ncbi:MAG: MFS transporter [candidate division Zixibacteria bacterium]|nr:MFS transporter [candidate division Zixibacteria bacterium]
MRQKIIDSIKDYWGHIRLFTPNVRKFLIGSFLISLTAAAGQLLLNLYLKERGASESFIGDLLSAGALGTTIIAIPAALALRRMKLKMALLCSTIIYTISLLLLSRLPVTKILLPISLMSGMAVTLYRIATAPFFMRNSTRKERTYVFSFGFGVTLMAGMVGSLTSGWLVSILYRTMPSLVNAYQWTFIIAVGAGFFALIPFFMIDTTGPTEEDKEADFSFGLFKTQFKLYAKLLTPQFFVGLGAGLIIPFLNLYFRDRFNQPPGKIGLFFFAVNAAMLMGILAGPVMARKFGMVKTIVATELLSIPFMIILAFTYSLPLAFAAFLARGALMNMAQPIGTNFGMEMVNRSEQALVNALMTLAWTSSWMISTAIGGKLIEKHGYTLPLMIAVILYIISAILYYLFFRKSEKKITGGFMVEIPS